MGTEGRADGADGRLEPTPSGLLVFGWVLLLGLTAVLAYHFPASSDPSSSISCVVTSPGRLQLRATVRNTDLRPRRIGVNWSVAVDGRQQRGPSGDLVTLSGRATRTWTRTVVPRQAGAARCDVEAWIERANSD